MRTPLERLLIARQRRQREAERTKRRRADKAHDRFGLEPLETRILLSADPVAALLEPADDLWRFDDSHVASTLKSEDAKIDATHLTPALKTGGTEVAQRATGEDLSLDDAQLQGAILDIVAGWDALLNGAGPGDDGLANADVLGLSIPLLGGSLADLLAGALPSAGGLDADDVLGATFSLTDVVTTYFASADPTLSGLADVLVTQFETRLGVSATDAGITISITAGYFSDSDEIRVDIDLAVPLASASNLDLSDQLGPLGELGFDLDTANASIDNIDLTLGAGFSLGIDVSAFGTLDPANLPDFGEFSSDQVFVRLSDPLNLTARINATGLDLGLTFDTGSDPDLAVGVDDGEVNALVRVELGVGNPDLDVNGRITLAELGNAQLSDLFDIRASGSLSATFPLSIEFGDLFGLNPGELADFGAPILTVNSANLFEFSTEGFDFALPSFGLDVQLNAALQARIEGLLLELDSAVSDLVGLSLLNLELPGIGLSVNELLNGDDGVGGSLRLSDVVSTYFDGFSGGNLPTLSGLIDTLNAQLFSTSALSIDLNNPFSAGLNFSGADGVGLDLRGFDFSGASLRGVDFSGANLAGVDFSGADLTGALFIGANLRGVNFGGANLSGINLRGAFAIGARFAGGFFDSTSDVTGLIVNDTTDGLPETGTPGAPIGLGSLIDLLPGLDFDGTLNTLLGLDAAFALDFTGYDLSGLDLSGIEFGGLDLRGVNLRGATLTGVDFSGVDLRGALAIGVDFAGALLGGADLRGLFRGGSDAPVTGATDTITLAGGLDISAALTAAGLGLDALRGFDLSGLDLTNIDFGGLDLTGVRFAGTDLGGAVFDALTGLRQVDLRGVLNLGDGLAGLDLSFANLSGLSLDGFDLSGVNLTGVSLRGASLSGVNLGDAVLVGADLFDVALDGVGQLGGAFLDAASNLSLPDLFQLDNEALVVTPTLFGEPSDAPLISVTGGLDPGEQLISLQLGINLDRALPLTFDLDAIDALGLDTDNDLGLTLEAEGRALLRALFRLDLTLGLDISSLIASPTDLDIGNDDVFFIVDNFVAGAAFSLMDVSATAGIDNLASVSLIDGQLAIGAGAQIEFTDPNDPNSNRISLATIAALGGGTLGDNFNDVVSITADGSVDAALTLTGDVGGIDLAEYLSPIVTITSTGNVLAGVTPDLDLDAVIGPTLSADISSVAREWDGALTGLDDNVLSAALPLIGSSLSELLGIGPLTDSLGLAELIDGYFSDQAAAGEPATVNGLLDVLDLGLGESALARNTVTADFLLGGRVSLTDEIVSLDIGFELSVDLDVVLDTLQSLLDEFGIGTDTLDLSALTSELTLGGALNIGVDLGNALSGNGVDGQDITVALTTPVRLALRIAGPIDATLTVPGGLVDVSVVGGTLSYVSSVEVTFTNPDQDVGGRMSLTELLDATSVGDLLDVSVGGVVEAVLPFDVSLDGLIDGSGALSDFATPTLILRTDQLFELNDDFSLTVYTPQVVLDLNLSEALVEDLLDLLDEVDQSIGDFTSEAIPLVGLTVADVLAEILPDGVAVDEQLSLRALVEDYLNNSGFTYDGGDPLTFPSLLGLLDAIDTSLLSRFGTTIDLFNPFQAGASFQDDQDASGLDLRGFDFSGALLRGVDFTGANLAGVDFSGADLTGALFIGANLRGVNFNGANLRGVDLRGAFGFDANFSGALFDGLSNLTGLFTGGSDPNIAATGSAVPIGLLDTIEFAPNLDILNALNLPGLPDLTFITNFQGYDLSGLDLSGINFDGIDLSGVNLRGALLTGANFNGVNLSGALAAGVDFSGALFDAASVLTGLFVDNDTTAPGAGIGLGTLINFDVVTTLPDVLRGFDLSGLDLSGIDFGGLDLRGVNFAGANLTGSTFAGANLSLADLRGALGLSSGAFAGLDLSFANLSGLDLSGFDFSGTNLLSARFVGVSLDGINFDGAQLSGVDFSGVVGDIGSAASAVFDAFTQGGTALLDALSIQGIDGTLIDIFEPADGPPIALSAGLDFDTLTLELELFADLRFLAELDFSLDDLGLDDGFEIIPGFPFEFPLSIDAFNGTLQAAAGVQFGVGVGLDINELIGQVGGGELPDQAIFFTFEEINGVTGVNAGAGLRAINVDVLASLGPLTGGIEGGSISVTSGLGINLTDPTPGDGRFTLADFASGVTIDIGPINGEAARLDATLPIVLANFDFDNLPSADGPLAIVITDDNIFADPAPSVDISGLGGLGLYALLNDPDFVFDVIDAFLDGLEDGLATGALNIDLPFVGNLGEQIDPIASLRSALADLADFLGADDPDTSPLTLLQDALFDLLGPDSSVPLLILEDINNDGVINARDIEIVGDNDFVQLNLHLGESLNFTLPIDFGGALPGFGLEVDGDIELAIDLDIMVGFGFSLTDFFYAQVLDPDDPTQRSEELRLDISARLSPGTELEIVLGFLAFTVTDLGVDDPANPGNLVGSGIAGALTVDLMNPDNDANDRLTLDEIANASFDEVVVASLTAGAELNLFGVLNLFEDDVFPSISAGIHYTQTFIDASTGSATNTFGGTPELEFTDVSLDLGTFFSTFVNPILTEVQKVTEPLEDVFDVLNAPLPVISDLGDPISPLELIEQTLGQIPQVQTALRFVRLLEDVVALVNSIPTFAPGETVIINFGGFDIGALGVNLREDEALSGADETPTNPDFDLASQADGQTMNFMSMSSNTGFVQGQGGGFDFPLLDDPTAIFGLLMGKDVDLFTFEFPSLELIFEYDATFSIFPGLFAGFDGSIELYADLVIGFDTLGLRAFAEDVLIPAVQGTTVSSPSFDDVVGYIFDGFFVRDYLEDVGDYLDPEEFLDNRDDPDEPRPDIGLIIEIGATAGVGVAGLVEAGVRGFIDAGIFLDFADGSASTSANNEDPPDDGQGVFEDDGRFRVAEVLDRIVNFGPHCIFDYSGALRAGLDAFLWVGLDLGIFGEITVFSDSFRLFEGTLASFEYTCAELDPPNVADQDANGVVTLDFDDSPTRAGANPPGTHQIRQFFEDPNETFTFFDNNGLEQERAGRGWVTRVTFNGFVKEFTDVTEIRANISGFDPMTGEGSTIIFTADEGAPAVDLYAIGSPGNDQISYFGTGRAFVFGGDGDDAIVGGDNNDYLVGGAGNDQILGGAGSDMIYGDEGDPIMDAALGLGGTVATFGDDDLDGGEGDDLIDGSAGDDRIKGGDGNDTLFGRGGNDDLIGNDGNDMLAGGDGDDRLSGADGRDMLLGEAGDDSLNGGRGVDDISGGAGADTINWNAGDGDDALVDAGTSTGADGEDTDVLRVVADDEDDDGSLIELMAAGANALFRYDSDELTLIGIESVIIESGPGADTIVIDDLVGTTITGVELALGGATEYSGTFNAEDENAPPIDTTITTDQEEDIVFLVGSEGDDRFVLSNFDLDGSLAWAVARIGDDGLPAFTLTVRQAELADILRVEGRGGDDRMDASALDERLLALVLAGEEGDDVLVGSRFIDQFEGGLGDDVVTGGLGVDVFSDAGGTDTLIEVRDADVFLTDDILRIGSENEDLGGVFEIVDLTGGASDNTYEVSNWRGIAFLDGGDGSDLYDVTLSGTLGGAIDSLIDVRDEGVSGVDTLNVRGTEADDILSFQRDIVERLVSDDADALFARIEEFSTDIFVRDTTQDPDISRQRVNYLSTENVFVFGRAGDDLFISDDTSTEVTVFGDAGDDRFFIGNVLSTTTAFSQATGFVEVVDELTNGVSFQATFDGGAGDDYFEVNHNVAEISLFGRAGDDIFFINAHITTEPSSDVNVHSAAGERDVISYVKNAPVNIFGGEGIDTLVIVGTVLDDVFTVFTEEVDGREVQRIYGAGLLIPTVDSVERLLIITGGGDDTVLIYGTLPGQELTINTGSGDDTIQFGGPAFNFDVTIPESSYTELVAVPQEPIVTSETVTTSQTFFDVTFREWFFGPEFTLTYTSLPPFVSLGVIGLFVVDVVERVETTSEIVTTVTPVPDLIVPVVRTLPETILPVFVPEARTLDALQGPVIVQGEFGNDRLIVNNQLAGANNSIGQLSLSDDGNNLLTGLGLGPMGLRYDDIEAANIYLGDFADDFTVDGTTATSTTNVFLGGGADAILIRSVGGALNVGGDVAEDFRLHLRALGELLGLTEDFDDDAIGDLQQLASALNDRFDRVPGDPLYIDPLGIALALNFSADDFADRIAELLQDSFSLPATVGDFNDDGIPNALAFVLGLTEDFAGDAGTVTAAQHLRALAARLNAEAGLSLALDAFDTVLELSLVNLSDRVAALLGVPGGADFDPQDQIVAIGQVLGLTDAAGASRPYDDSRLSDRRALVAAINAAEGLVPGDAEYLDESAFDDVDQFVVDLTGGLRDDIWQLLVDNFEIPGGAIDWRDFTDHLGFLLLLGEPFNDRGPLAVTHLRALATRLTLAFDDVFINARDINRVINLDLDMFQDDIRVLLSEWADTQPDVDLTLDGNFDYRDFLPELGRTLNLFAEFDPDDPEQINALRELAAILNEDVGTSIDVGAIDAPLNFDVNSIADDLRELLIRSLNVPADATDYREHFIALGWYLGLGGDFNPDGALGTTHLRTLAERLNDVADAGIDLADFDTVLAFDITDYEDEILSLLQDFDAQREDFALPLFGPDIPFVIDDYRRELGQLLDLGDQFETSVNTRLGVLHAQVLAARLNAQFGSGIDIAPFLAVESFDPDDFADDILAALIATPGIVDVNAAFTESLDELGWLLGLDRAFDPERALDLQFAANALNSVLGTDIDVLGIARVPTLDLDQFATEVWTLLTDARGLVADPFGADLFTLFGADGTLNTINGPIGLDGNAGDDVLRILDTGDATDNDGVLTGNTLTGLGLGDVVTYSDFSELTLQLGSGSDVLTIQGTSIPTFVFGGAGDDTLVISTASDGAPGSAQDVRAALSVDAQSGSNQLIVNNEDDQSNANVVITGSTITGLAPAQITYAATLGNFDRDIVISTGRGNDQIEIAGLFTDALTVVRGNAGDDVIAVTAAQNGSARLHVHGEDGDDELDASTAGLRVTLDGGNDDDVLTGSAFDDVLRGGADRDRLMGLAGDDTLLGDETVVLDAAGVAVTTRVPSTGDDDVLIGGAGSDRLEGQAGNDALVGDHGEVTDTQIEALSEAGAGDDLLLGGEGGDWLLGGLGDDALDGSDGDDVLLGDDGILQFDDNGVLVRIETVANEADGDDTLAGGGQDDVLIGGNGSDAIDAGDGDDLVLGDTGRVDATEITTIDAPGAGDDVVDGGEGDDILLGGGGDDNLMGGDGSDVLLGDGGDIALSAGDIVTVETQRGSNPGDDVLAGDAGNDVLVGGGGNDELFTGSGDDILLGDNGLIEFRQGSPVLAASTDQSASDGGDDLLQADSGSNVLIGGAGADDLNVLGGNNVLIGDNGKLTLDPDTNTRIVESQDASFGGDDLIVGTEGNDVLFGGAGNDTLLGMAGDDTLFGDGGRVTFVNGVLAIAEGTNFFVGGDDTLDGGAGNDVLIGGFGNDGLVGSLDEDALIFEHARVTFDPDGRARFVVVLGQAPLDLAASQLFGLYNAIGTETTGRTEAPTPLPAPLPAPDGANWLPSAAASSDASTRAVSHHGGMRAMWLFPETPEPAVDNSADPAQPGDAPQDEPAPEAGDPLPATPPSADDTEVPEAPSEQTATPPADDNDALALAGVLPVALLGWQVSREARPAPARRRIDWNASSR